MALLSNVGTKSWDALIRALRGSFSALWVPPVGAVVDVLIRAPLLGPLTFDHAFGIYMGLGVAALLGLLLGAAWLLLLGVPVLFGLTLVRASHPLIAAAQGGCLMYWLYYGHATQTVIGAAADLLAAINARSNPLVQRTASPAAERQR